MSGAVAALAIVTAVGAACTGGALYAFSSFVMPALKRLPAAQGVAAMQSINVTAVRAPFMLPFVGSAALSVAVIVAGIAAIDEAHGPWMLVAAGLYLIGVFGLTMTYHVPRNDALDRLDPEAPATEAAWRTYYAEWTAANHVRAAAAARRGRADGRAAGRLVPGPDHAWRRLAWAATTRALVRVACVLRACRRPADAGSGVPPAASWSSSRRWLWRATIARILMCVSVTAMSHRTGVRQRASERDRQAAGAVVIGHETESEDVLGANDWLRWLAAIRAGHEVCRGGTGEAQPTAWAADLGHSRPFHWSPGGRV